MISYVGEGLPSALSAMGSMSSTPLLFMVEPLQRADFVDAGDSPQLDQSLSSSESNPKGVQEKCLFFATFAFSRLAASLDVLGRVGVDAVEVGVSKALLALARAAGAGLMVS